MYIYIFQIAIDRLFIVELCGEGPHLFLCQIDRLRIVRFPSRQDMARKIIIPLRDVGNEPFRLRGDSTALGASNCHLFDRRADTWVFTIEQGVGRPGGPVQRWESAQSLHFLPQ